VAEALDAPQAWQPLDAGWGSMELDDEPASPTSRYHHPLCPDVIIVMVFAGAAGEDSPLGSIHSCRLSLAAVGRQLA
jgi:hypothetical protein